MDQAKADDLHDTIRSRQKILGDFEQSVLKIIQPGVAPERSAVEESIKKEEAKPVFKEGVAREFYNLVKDYLLQTIQSHLKKLLPGQLSCPRRLFLEVTETSLQMHSNSYLKQT